MANKMLGKYELLEELGRGGFGTVYRARDTSLDVERAVKVLHPALVAAPEFIERFRREAKVAARLDHPYIVPVYEFGELRGSYFLVMKYLPGGSLKDVLAKSGRLPFARAVEIARQIARALEYAYSQPEKLIHRDIKPGNILFEADLPDGTGGAARLADFGFAKALSGASSSSLTSSGGMVGTPPYMPPEVWRHKEFTPATDVYSLACVFFEMITGNVLFHGDSPADIMTMHVLDGPQFPEQWPAGVPQGVENVLGKALAGDSQERYQSMSEFVAVLEQTISAEAIHTKNVEASSQAALEEKAVPLISTQKDTKENVTGKEESIPAIEDVEAPQAARQLEDEPVSTGLELYAPPEEMIPQARLLEEQVPSISIPEESMENPAEPEAAQASTGQADVQPASKQMPPPAALPSDDRPGMHAPESKPKRKLPAWGIVLIVIVCITGWVILLPKQSSPTQPAAPATQAPVTQPSAIQAPATDAPVPLLLPTLTQTPPPTPMDTVIQSQTDCSSLPVCKQVEVVAKKGFQPVGISIQKGQNVRITYVSGIWAAWPGNDGYPYDSGSGGSYIPWAGFNAMIAKIGANTVPFLVQGQSYQFKADVSADLYLSINDNDTTDETGSIIVLVEVW